MVKICFGLQILSNSKNKEKYTSSPLQNNKKGYFKKYES